MDPKPHEDQLQNTTDDIQGYTLAAAAHKLNIHPSTLRFWEESFRQELGVPRNWKGDLIFSDHHLEIIRRIQRMVMGEGHTLAEARRAARTGDFPEYDDLPALDASASSVSGSERGVSRVPTHEVTSPSRPDESWRQELEEIRASLTQLMEHVAYLLEENRSFQELFARLVNHVESGGTVTNGSLAKKKGFVLEQPFTERIVQNEIVETRNMTDTQDDAQFHDAQVAAAADQPDSTDASDDSSLWPSDMLDDLSELEELAPPTKKPRFEAGLPIGDDQPQPSRSPGNVIGKRLVGKFGSVAIQSWMPNELDKAQALGHAGGVTPDVRVASIHKQFAS